MHLAACRIAENFLERINRFPFRDLLDLWPNNAVCQRGVNFTRSFGMKNVFLHPRYEIRTVASMSHTRWIHTIGMKLVGMNIILYWYEFHTTVFAVCGLGFVMMATCSRNMQLVSNLHVLLVISFSRLSDQMLPLFTWAFELFLDSRSRCATH